MMFAMNTPFTSKCGCVIGLLLIVSSCAREKSSDDVSDKSLHPSSNATISGQSESGSSPNEPYYCGDRLASGEAIRYANTISSDLKKYSSRILDADLFDSTVEFVSDGESNIVDKQTLAGYSGALPTANDWVEIASRIKSGNLISVGWRGCILSGGKVAFQTDKKGHLKLYSFDFDRAWQSE